MPDFCPLCETVGNLEVTVKDFDFNFHGEKITVKNVEVYRCPRCEEDIYHRRNGEEIDTLEEVYEEYVRRRPEVPKWWEIEDKEERERVMKKHKLGVWKE